MPLRITYGLRCGCNYNRRGLHGDLGLRFVHRFGTRETSSCCHASETGHYQDRQGTFQLMYRATVVPIARRDQSMIVEDFFDLDCEFVIGGYTPAGRNFGAILIGDYEGRALKYVAKVHGGFTPAVRTAVYKLFQELETDTCPFKNLPEARRGQWGEGLTAAEMEKCRWLRPKLFATIDYLERTAANHLRHAMFGGLTANPSVKGSMP
jgi:ATP dependent DNA ligase-like protein